MFFDNDGDSKLQEAFRIIEKEEVFFIAFSSICIEHWFILHFEHCGRAFSRAKDAGKYLERLWPEYHKTKIKHYDILHDKLTTAMARAKVLRDSREFALSLYQCNPYTTVDMLVEFVRGLAKT